MERSMGFCLSRTTAPAAAALIMLAMNALAAGPDQTSFDEHMHSVDQTDATAVFNAHKGMAADDNSVAQYELGLDYLAGRGTSKDEAEGSRWMQKAADHDNPRAQFVLSLGYKEGVGLTANPAKALHWARKSAEQGHPCAQLLVATLYLQGVGAAQSYTEAEKWLERAAAQGERTSMFDLGVLYGKGLGVPQSPGDSYLWFTLAAQRKFQAAIDVLGKLGSLPDEMKQAAKQKADAWKATLEHPDVFDQSDLDACGESEKAL
jgi:TPR repeat protein